jgi:hypothetical protein
MKKTLLYFLLVFVGVGMSASSCNDDDADQLMSAMRKISKTWRVTEASFGTEEAVEGMYANYSITFTQEGGYSVINPEGVPTPTHGVDNTGTWGYDLAQKVINFDAGSPQENMVYVTYLAVDGNQMQWEWDVELEGKTRTTYRFTLEAVR